MNETTTPGFADRLAGLVTGHPWTVILLVLAAAIAASAGMTRLQVESDARIWFGERNPQYRALVELENTYTRTDTVYFAIAPRIGDVFNRKTLNVIEELTEAGWQLPWSTRVNSITNYQHTWAAHDELVVEDLVRDATDLSEEQLARIRQVVLGEPLLINRLVSGDGRVAAISINVLKPVDSPSAVAEVAAHANHLLAELRGRYPDHEIHLTGSVMFDHAFAESTEHDMKTFVPAMLAVLALCIALLLRSLSAMFATLIVILLSTFTAMGLGGWLGMSISPASGMAPTIILTLAVADSIHILVTVFQRLRAGVARREAIVQSMHVNLQPVTITSVTTVIGFAAMNFSDAPPFHTLGNMVAMGVAAALVYSVTILPALMTILPLRVHASQATDDAGAMPALADFVLRHRTWLFRASLLLVVGSTLGIARIDLNDNFLEYLDDRYPVRVSTEFVQQRLSGMDMIEYSLSSGEPGGISEPHYLRTIDAFASWYREQPNVVFSPSFADIIKRLNRNMHDDDPALHRVPENRELAAQYLLLYEMSLPYGLDLNDQVSIDKSATRLRVLVRNQTTRSLRELDTTAGNWLRTNAPPGMFTVGSGLSVMFAHISERNINTMLWGSGLALVLISLLLIVALGSLRFGLLSLVPNLAPALMALGIWGFTVGQVGLASAVLIALTLGIVVDDTVHFLTKYLRARREQGLAPEAAIHYAFSTVGTAMWVTTAVLVAGFGTLSLSGYKINADMGALCAFTIVLALALDFLFLPTLLLKAEKTTKN